MDNLSIILNRAFGAELSAEFKAGAFYYDCADFVEYIAEDDITVAERIDEYLTLLWDSSRLDVIGFRIKGFKHLFNTHLKPLYDLSDRDFLPMITVVQAVIQRIGEELTSQDNRKRAYKKVIKLTKDSNIQICSFPDFSEAA